MSRTVIVVPCYNETSRIRLEEFVGFSPPTGQVEFLFVDDGSTDGTSALLEAQVEADSRKFSLFRLEKNKGKAEAVRQGVMRAFDSGPSYVGIWDADLAAPLSEIPRYLAVLERAPSILLVMGARVRLLGRAIRRTAVRHYLGRMSATLISLVLGLPCYDTQCGAKLLRASPIMRNVFAEPFISLWIFDAEVLARMVCISRTDARINPLESVYKLPLLEWHDRSGSKIGPGDYLLSLVDLWKIWRKYC